MGMVEHTSSKLHRLNNLIQNSKIVLISKKNYNFAVIITRSIDMMSASFIESQQKQQQSNNINISYLLLYMSPFNLIKSGRMICQLYNKIVHEREILNNRTRKPCIERQEIFQNQSKPKLVYQRENRLIPQTPFDHTLHVSVSWVSFNLDIPLI